jgi:hypothetical protein
LVRRKALLAKLIAGDAIENAGRIAWSATSGERRDPIVKILLVFFPAFALCQKPTPKPFVPPDTRVYIFSSVLAKDDGCARDYAKTYALNGLSRRKAIAELLTYGCIEQLKGVYRGDVLASITVGDAGPKLTFQKLSLIMDDEFAPGALVGANRSDLSKTGWVLSTEIMSRREMEALHASVTKKP